jgi:hypothetical protein
MAIMFIFESLYHRLYFKGGWHLEEGTPLYGVPSSRKTVPFLWKGMERMDNFLKLIKYQ